MRFTIKFKLGLAFGLMTLMLIGIAVYGVMSLSTLNQASSDMVDGPVQRMQLSLLANVHQVDAIRAQKNAQLADNQAEAAQYFKEAITDIDAMLSSVQQGLAIASAEGKPSWEKLINQGTTFRELSLNLENLVKTGKADEAKDLSTGEMRKMTTEMGQSVNALLETNKQFLDATTKANEALYAGTISGWPSVWRPPRPQMTAASSSSNSISTANPC